MLILLKHHNVTSVITAWRFCQQTHSRNYNDKQQYDANHSDTRYLCYSLPLVGCPLSTSAGILTNHWRQELIIRNSSISHRGYWYPAMILSRLSCTYVAGTIYSIIHMRQRNCVHARFKRIKWNITPIV